LQGRRSFPQGEIAGRDLVAVALFGLWRR
jgi:hypothetical protein